MQKQDATHLMSEQPISTPSVRIPSPNSTGGGGYTFQDKVQAGFVILMFLDGFVPCFPDWPIKEIKLQGKWAGSKTDDMVLAAENPATGEQRNLLCQITQTVSFTKGDGKFWETIRDAWRDFNNPQVFRKDVDQLSLFAGLLPGSACKDVTRLLETARTSADATEFQTKIKTPGFCSGGVRDMFEAFLCHLKNANGGPLPSDEDWFAFLSSFHVDFFDFEIPEGLVRSVIQTDIGMKFKNPPDVIWQSTCATVRTYDGYADTIRKTTKAFASIFQPGETLAKPTAISNPESDDSKSVLASEDASVLVRLALLGEWRESSRDEKQCVFDFLGIDEREWESRSRSLLLHEKTPLSFHNKTWNCTERDRVVLRFGKYLTEKDLDKFEEIAVRCLSEPDPFVGLRYDDWASLKNAEPKREYSSSFKLCLAESLAILSGARASFPENVRRRIEAVCGRVVRTLLFEADWIRWASLSKGMPALAESAPEVFLAAVDESLRKRDNPFKPWLAAVCDKNVVSGDWGEFVDAFEVLAWNESRLVRCCNDLAVFADMAPQTADWATGPLRALSKILLPWFPQTKAPFEKRRAAIVSISGEHPEIGWKTLLALLPNPGSIAIGSSKPKWNDAIEKNWEPKITTKEYVEQVEQYAILAAKLAAGNENRLAELIEESPRLPPRATKAVMLTVLSKRTLSLPENRKTVVWEAIKSLLVRSKQFHGDLFRDNPELCNRLRKAETVLRPKTTSILFRRLFTEAPVNLFRLRADWRKENEKLRKEQGKALLRIIRAEGVEKLAEIVRVARLPIQVGMAFACVPDSRIEAEVLLFFLGKEQPNEIGFINGFVIQRFSARGWPWVDSLERKGWTNAQTGEFLAALPFEEDSWKRLSRWLTRTNADKFYWNRIPRWLQLGKTDLKTAIKRLLSHGRADLALELFSTRLEAIDSFDTRQIERTLLALPLQRKVVDPLDDYVIQQLMELLQKRPDRDSIGLEEIEWQYLARFEYRDGYSPRALMAKLSSNADFFCEMVALKESASTQPCRLWKTEYLAEELQKRAEFLLEKWNLVPGTTSDGSFNCKSFRAWIRRVRTIAKKRKIEKSVERRIGEVLIYAPADPTGLWIHKEIASLLNEEQSDEMRRQYQISRFNAAQTMKLASSTESPRKRIQVCLDQADAVENEGYFRLATELRALAKSYEDIFQWHQEMLGAD